MFRKFSVNLLSLSLVSLFAVSVANASGDYVVVDSSGNAVKSAAGCVASNSPNVVADCGGEVAKMEVPAVIEKAPEPVKMTKPMPRPMVYPRQTVKIKP